MNTDLSNHCNSLEHYRGNGYVIQHVQKTADNIIKRENRTAVKEVRYTSRTDGNGIYPGHRYELGYFGSDGWQPVACKEATADSLTFESVPANALYWLKNLTEGKEERIFTYENGQIKFW